ncbi:hypothetical protein RUM43_004773 [Polyplax serrata]|uniref:Uncharacterized protein n=1 Tax=Polyplax serrata TaxID=468196 RepID=A0AAN8XLN5_POLSC
MAVLKKCPNKRAVSPRVVKPVGATGTPQKMFYNETDDVGYVYGTGSDLAVFNCANSTATNCSYIDPNEFYGASSLDPEDEERLQNIIRVVVPEVMEFNRIRWVNGIPTPELNHSVQIPREDACVFTR